MNKAILISVFAILFALLGASGVLAKPPAGIAGDVTVVNDAGNAVPVTIQGDVPVTIQGNVATTQRVPIAASGEWTQAGLALPSMILHDLIVYYDPDAGEPATCTFSINFVIDQFASRTLHRASLAQFENLELHYEAGIDTSNLRLGTVGSACTRNWAAMGYAVE